jgi:hypothetical protein
LGITPKESYAFYIGGSRYNIIKNDDGDLVFKFFIINNSDWSGKQDMRFQDTDFGKSVLKISNSYSERKQPQPQPQSQFA